MGVKRVISTDFWKDDIVAEEYSAEDRYFMLYLLSNPNSTQCGIYHLPVRTIAFEMGYKESAVQAIMERFLTKFKNIKYSQSTKEIAILNFLKHSIIKGGKPVEDCIRKELSQVKDASLINLVYRHMKSYIDKQILINDRSMYIGIDKVFKEFINDNDNDNDNEVSWYDTLHDTLREVKKPCKPPKEPTIYFPNDEKLNQTFLDFIEMRKSLKNGTMTERAISMMVTKLSKLDNDTAIQMLEQSITNNWKDIYPLKEQKDFQSVIERWGND
jgi:hypothetical protein